MTKKQEKITFGYLEGFKNNSNSSILFLGTNNSILEFIKFFEGLLDFRVGDQVSLANIDAFAAKLNTTVVIEIDERDRGAKKPEGKETEVLWKMSINDIDRFISQLKKLSNSSLPAHEYLDIETYDEVAIIVSVNEYSELILS